MPLSSIGLAAMSRSNRGRPQPAAKLPLGGIASEAAGFTLIEVLVAFTIAVLALGVLYRASSTGLNAGGAAGRYNNALLIAESTLDAIGVERPLAPHQSTRRVDETYDEHVIVRARPDLAPGSDVSAWAYPYEVLVDITWREGRRDRSIELKTIRLGV